jgi:ABC-type Fe3+-hydroxamate transport system substrate-binding protein
MGRVPRRALLAAIVLMALVLAGCGIKDEPTGAVDPFPTSAIDAAGEAVAVTAEPVRIVSADPGATAILRDLGLGDVTTEATTSTVAAAAADPLTALVVVPLSLDAAALQQLRASTGAPVFRYGADPLAEAPAIVTQLGVSVGRGPPAAPNAQALTPRAATIAKAMTSGLDALAERLAGEPRVRTLIEGAGFIGYGPGSSAGMDVAAAGGENVLAMDQPIDIAALPGLQIDAWVSLQPGGSSLTSLQRFPELTDVPAVAESRIISMPRGGFPIDAALPGALQALADDLHAAPLTAG